MFYRIIDDHLALKLASSLDAEELFDLVDLDRGHLREFLPWVDDTHSVEDRRSALEKDVPTWPPNHGVTTWITFDGQMIGAVAIHFIDWEARWGEVGYWIESSYEGKGYVTRAVREIERMAFLDLGLERIQITNDVNNVRSRAIPERLGYTLEGVLRHHILTDGTGRIADRSVYSILKSEWKAREGLS